jgi:hypothetical protein
MARKGVRPSIGRKKVNTAGHSRKGDQRRNGDGLRNPEEILFVGWSFVVKLSTTFLLPLRSDAETYPTKTNRVLKRKDARKKGRESDGFAWRLRY